MFHLKKSIFSRRKAGLSLKYSFNNGKGKKAGLISFYTNL
jgi:hypothetical protein